MPSEATPAASRRWLRRLAEVVFFIALFAAASLWLSRHMLQTDSVAPPLLLPPLIASEGSTVQRVSWPSAHDRTLVYFFAPWCQVCRVSMPGLNLLATDDQQLRVVAVALDWESKQEVAQFIDRTGYTGEVLLGNRKTGEAWQISGYPSYYVVDQSGVILHADRGLSTPPGLWLRTHL